jgi:phage baseplate assembly protein W
MARTRYVNIDFPFKDSRNGFYFKLNQTDRDAIKADLLHLLLTNKGERLYLPDFGSDLQKYIFEPNDSITHEEIRDSLNDSISLYIPNLVVNSIEFKKNSIEESIIVELSYSVTDGTFSSTDTLTLTF